MNLHTLFLPSGGVGAGLSRRAQDSGIPWEKQNTPTERCHHFGCHYFGARQFSPCCRPAFPPF
jgi:hypothetical protein